MFLNLSNFYGIPKVKKLSLKKKKRFDTNNSISSVMYKFGFLTMFVARVAFLFSQFLYNIIISINILYGNGTGNKEYN